MYILKFGINQLKKIKLNFIKVIKGKILCQKK